MELLPFYLTSHQVGELFGVTWMVGLITEPLGFVQDT